MRKPSKFWKLVSTADDQWDMEAYSVDGEYAICANVWKGADGYRYSIVIGDSDHFAGKTHTRESAMIAAEDRVIQHHQVLDKFLQSIDAGLESKAVKS